MAKYNFNKISRLNHMLELTAFGCLNGVISDSENIVLFTVVLIPVRTPTSKTSR